MKYRTILINGYAYQVGTDPRATGGVHLVQVAKSANGWRTRIVDSNGRHESAGPSTDATRAEVDSLILRAAERAKSDERNGRACCGAADREEVAHRKALKV